MANQIINIMNSLDYEVDPAMLVACLKKVGEQIANSPVTEANLFVGTRLPSGWLEYTICLQKPGHGYVFTIVAIQRTIGAEIEFHS